MGRVAELLLYFVGAASASISVIPPSSWSAVAVPAALVTGLHLAAGTRRAGAMRVLCWVARAALVPLYAVWAYIAIVFGWLLGWTVSRPIRYAILLAAVAAVVGLGRRIAGVRVPVLLPLGMWMAFCLLGWKREDGVIRCDDYARFLSDPAVTLAIPTTKALASCAPGEVLRLERYPRRVWEAPDGSRYLVTTQPGYNYFRAWGAGSRPARRRGVRVRRRRIAPRLCQAAYKTQAIFDAERLDRVFAVGWNGMDGGLYAFPRSSSLRVVA